MGGVFLINEQESESMVFIDKTVLGVLTGKYPPKRKPHRYMLESYGETTVFIPVDMTEDLVELVAWKFWGSAGPGGTDLEALQGWLLKF